MIDRHCFVRLTVSGGYREDSCLQPPWDNPSTPAVTPAPRGYLPSTFIATCQMFLAQLPDSVVRMRTMVQVQEGAVGTDRLLKPF